MDLSRTRVVLRERAVVDVLDLAVRFVVVHGAAYARTAVLVLPPFLVASIVLARSVGAVLAWTFTIFAATFASAPFTALASRLVFEDDVRVSLALRTAARASFRLFVLRLVAVVGGLLGASFFGFPGVWFLSLTLFTDEATLLEHAPPREAIARSMRLVRRESGEALMTLLLLWILQAALVAAADFGGRAVISALLEARAPASLWDDGWSILALLGFWLFVPYVATARLLVYLDVRTRSEGWDIQTRFASLAARAETGETRSAA